MPLIRRTAGRGGPRAPLDGSIGSPASCAVSAGTWFSWIGRTNGAMLEIDARFHDTEARERRLSSSGRSRRRDRHDVAGLGPSRRALDLTYRSPRNHGRRLPPSTNYDQLHGILVRVPSSVGAVLDAQQVELVGTSWLVAQLVADGLEVARPERDRGIDLIAYLDDGRFRAVPILLKAATGRRFELMRKYERLGPRLLLAFAWNIRNPSKTSGYALTYREALKVAKALGWTKTASWERAGCSSQRPSARVVELLEPYRMGPGHWAQKISELSQR